MQACLTKSNEKEISILNIWRGQLAMNRNYLVCLHHFLQFFYSFKTLYFYAFDKVLFSGIFEVLVPDNY